MICDSYHAELHALRLALRALAEDGRIAVPRGAEIQILTDSQSAIRALAAGPWRQRSRLPQQVWSGLCKVSEVHDAHVTLVYVPGHADIAGNEEADEEAKEAARAAQGTPGGDPTPVPHGLARTVVRAHGRRDMWQTVRKERAT